LNLWLHSTIVLWYILDLFTLVGSNEMIWDLPKLECFNKKEQLLYPIHKSIQLIDDKTQTISYYYDYSDIINPSSKKVN